MDHLSEMEKMLEITPSNLKPIGNAVIELIKEQPSKLVQWFGNGIDKKEKDEYVKAYSSAIMLIREEEDQPIDSNEVSDFRRRMTAAYQKAGMERNNSEVLASAIAEDKLIKTLKELKNDGTMPGPVQRQLSTENSIMTEEEETDLFLAMLRAFSKNLHARLESRGFLIKVEMSKFDKLGASQLKRKHFKMRMEAQEKVKMMKEKIRNQLEERRKRDREMTLREYREKLDELQREILKDLPVEEDIICDTTNAIWWQNPSREELAKDAKKMRVTLDRLNSMAERNGEI